MFLYVDVKPSSGQGKSSCMDIFKENIGCFDQFDDVKFFEALISHNFKNVQIFSGGLKVRSSQEKCGWLNLLEMTLRR